MTTHPFDILPLANGAKLIFTPCPGTKEASLVDSVATLKQAGANMVLTTMFDAEMQENNAQDLPSICKENGITWLQLPISDDAAPDAQFETNWQAYLPQILSLINSQGTIAVHCKGGSGRTGLVIGLILLATGMPAGEVIEKVQTMRPKALKHPVQLDYFNAYTQAT